MCIAFYTLSSHPAYSLILATNRDELLNRPALPAHWHGGTRTEDNTVLCGIDVTGGGTWFGIERKTGKFGLLTNVREETTSPQATSRGRLVTDWLESQSDVDVDAHLGKLQTSMMDYAGFNILLGQINPEDGDGRVQLGFLSNRSRHVGHVVDGHPVQRDQDCIRQLQDGSPYGVMSNGALACATDSRATDALNTAWPKMQTGSKAFEKAVKEHAESGDRRESLVEALMDVLNIAPVEITDKEDVRSSVLVTPFDMFPPRKAWYGTRAQSVLLVEKDTGRCHFVERQAYELVDGKPSWSGQIRNWDFSIG